MDTTGFLEPQWVVLVVIGLLFGGLGGYWLWTSLSFWRRAERVSGLVTDLHSRTEVQIGGVDLHVSGNLSFPVLQFTTHEGRDVETTARMGARPMPARPGDELTVLYDPTEPSTAELTIWYRLGFSVIFLVIGLGALFVYAIVTLNVSIDDRFFIAGLFGGLGLPFVLLGATTLWTALRVRRTGYSVFGGLFVGIGLFLWGVFGVIVFAVGGL